MSFQTEFIDGGTGALRIGRGVVTGQEIIDSVESFLSTVDDPMRITHQLVDFTKVDAFDVFTEDMERAAFLALRNAKRMGKVRLAIAAPGDVAYGMCRMFGALVYRSEWSICIVRAREEAVAWLGSRLDGQTRA